MSSDPVTLARGRTAVLWLAVAGVVVMIAASFTLGARTGISILGAELLVLAAVRACTSWADRIASRSRSFDVVLLAGIGVAILVLGLTADNV
ncbi:DUF3017 domain-containing protein [Pseudactinotalea sp. HY160]|uniref:DUF3017 domain-containing protein n=1 Tax=Pseudactinotalea sp. HY160 TaxID=2654490 RepID=UPI00128D42A1|nr:DUF3017 domain-containing protein [Pseudactinotalea sp. HY160]MPV50816.1 DUF3017 domain-containing protein [Pseudactinotalea sp. HY160]